MELGNHELNEFFRKREIPDSVIDALINENIDQNVIPFMKDEQLKEYFPRAGDRMATVNFCNKMLTRTKWNSKKIGFVDKLIEKCRKNEKKRNISGSSDECGDAVASSSTQIRKKPTRQIQIGWLCSEDGNRHMQVKTKNGGGTRTITIRKTATKEYILQKGKELFFINGKSAKGDENDFCFDLWDFAQNPISDTMSVEQMFNATGFTRLRFYVATSKKTSTVTSQVSDIVNDGVCTQEAVIDAIDDVPDTHQHCEASYANLVADVVNNDTIFDDMAQIYEFDILSDSAGNAAIEIIDPVQVILHRGQIMEELISIFINLPETCGRLIIEIMMPNGQKEAAYDLGGVYRDALSEFWSSFYEQCTIGTDSKVPFVRHDFDSTKWKAVARIYYRGWKDEKYLPLKLSAPFVEYCMYGVVTSDIRGSFLSFVSRNEKDTLQKALNDFSSVDSEELLDVLDSLECKSIVQAENIEKILDDIGHKEIVQKPMFVIDCWADILKNLIPLDELKRIYNEHNVTSKNVLGVLKMEVDSNVPNQLKIFGFLKKYVRECTETQLTNFMRFCTGADVLTGNVITVSFNETSGFSRAPMARTCGNILNLSNTYQSFPEFRSEMNGILELSIWIMDIV